MPVEHAPEYSGRGKPEERMTICTVQLRAVPTTASVSRDVMQQLLTESIRENASKRHLDVSIVREMGNQVQFAVAQKNVEYFTDMLAEMKLGTLEAIKMTENHRQSSTKEPRENHQGTRVDFDPDSLE